MITALQAWGSVLLMASAAMGAGAAALAAIGVLGRLRRDEATAWSFAIGFGVMGWLVLPMGAAGAIGVAPMVAVCVALIPGLVLITRCAPAPTVPQISRTSLLLLPIALAVLFDLAEGLAPPVDADSLAYHFALPKQFLAEGVIRFVPRAVDGAVPLTVQMSYLPALALGGERALTLWTMVSGWAAIVLAYLLARRHLVRGWSLALAALLITTPAVVYGAGAGQIEARVLLFTMTGGFATAWAVGARGGAAWRWALLAGLCAGFFAGSKYTGLLFVAACGLTLLVAPAPRHEWVTRVTAFCVAAALAGSPWYLWNAWHTGDPIFPMLYGILPYVPGLAWGSDHADAFREVMFSVERGVPPSIGWFFAYPFLATLDALPQWEARRTGLGPACLLLLPFALGGMWRWRDRIASSPLLPVACVVLLFYTLWFFLGTAQRVRHLLPVYPLLLLCVLVAAARWQTRVALARPWRNPVLGVVLLSLAIQLAGHGLFALSYLTRLADGEDRDAFLSRTLANHSPAVPWINASLSSSDRLLLSERQLIYHLDVPLFYGHPHFQAEVDSRPNAFDPPKFWRDARRLGITHVLFRGTLSDDHPVDDTDGLRTQVLALAKAGCARSLQVFTGRDFASRTLQTIASADLRLTLAALTPGGCPLANDETRGLEPAAASAEGAG